MNNRIRTADLIERVGSIIAVARNVNRWPSAIAFTSMIDAIEAADRDAGPEGDAEIALWLEAIRGLRDCSLKASAGLEFRSHLAVSFFLLASAVDAGR